MQTKELHELLTKDGYELASDVEDVSVLVYYNGKDLILLMETKDHDGILFKQVHKLAEVFPIMKKGSMIS